MPDRGMFNPVELAVEMLVHEPESKARVEAALQRLAAVHAKVAEARAELLAIKLALRPPPDADTYFPEHVDRFERGLRVEFEGGHVVDTDPEVALRGQLECLVSQCLESDPLGDFCKELMEAQGFASRVELKGALVTGLGKLSPADVERLATRLDALGRHFAPRAKVASPAPDGVTV